MAHGYSGPSYQEWRPVQWIIIPVGVLAALVFGTVGFREYGRVSQESLSLSSCFYSALQLFVLHMPHLDRPVPWTLDMARFLAPLTLGYGAVQAFLAGLRHLCRVCRLPFWHDHVVVCGLSQKALLLIQDYLGKERKRGPKVVVIERDPNHEFLPAVHDAGAAVLYGDACDEKVLARAGVERCLSLIAATQSDTTNVEVAVRAVSLLASRPARPGWPIIRCYVHLSEPGLRSHFRGCPGKLPQSAGRMQVEVIGIDPYESSARRAFRDCPLDDPPITRRTDRERVHLIVLHAGQMGTAVLVQAAKIAHFANSRILKATLLWEEGTRRPVRETLLERYPQIEKTCELQLLSFSAKDPRLANRLAALCREEDTLPTVMFCHPDEGWNVSHALSLQRELAGERVSILTRMTARRGLTTLLTGPAVGAVPAGRIKPFGMVEDVFCRDVLLDEKQDLLARRIHEAFVQVAVTQGRDPDQDAGIRPWEELAEVFRDSNRQQADHIPVKLRAIGCRAAPAGEVKAPVTSFSPDEVELLAEMEHARWCAERHLAGWAYAPGEKNVAARTHPALVECDRLDEATRDYDRKAVLLIPELVAAAGERIERLGGGPPAEAAPPGGRGERPDPRQEE